MTVDASVLFSRLDVATIPLMSHFDEDAPLGLVNKQALQKEETSVMIHIRRSRSFL